MKKTHKKFVLIGALVILGVILLRYCTGLTDGGIAGFDRNRDGVRDDIEAFIDKEYGHDKRLRSVIRQLAKDIQNKIEHPDTTDYRDSGKTLNCLRHLVGDGAKVIDMLRAIESAAANTYPRIRAFIRHNARFNGKILTSYPGDVKSACDFDPSLVP